VPLRPNTCDGEKGSGYSFPHWEAVKGRASERSGPQSDLKRNEIELNLPCLVVTIWRAAAEAPSPPRAQVACGSVARSTAARLAWNAIIPH